MSLVGGEFSKLGHSFFGPLQSRMAAGRLLPRLAHLGYVDLHPPHLRMNCWHSGASLGESSRNRLTGHSSELGCGSAEIIP